MRVSTHSSWKCECSPPGTACCSVCALFATMGSRLQTGDLSEFVGVRCILTMQFHHRYDETPRDYVVAATTSAKMRLGPRFSHRAKAALNESLDIAYRERIERARRDISHFPIVIYCSKERDREQKNGYIKIRN